MDIPDNELEHWIDRLNKGQSDAAWTLVTCYAARLHDLAHDRLRDFKCLRDVEDSDDMMQEAAIRLRKVVAAAPPGTVHAFKLIAAEVVRRVLLDRNRYFYGPHGLASHRAMPEGHNLGHADPVDASSDDDEMVDWAAFQEQIAALPVRERQIVELRWYRKATLPEIAALLGISEVTCRRRWKRACRFLRAKVGDDFSDG